MACDTYCNVDVERCSRRQRVVTVGLASFRSRPQPADHFLDDGRDWMISNCVRRKSGSIAPAFAREDVHVGRSSLTWITQEAM